MDPRLNSKTRSAPARTGPAPVGDNSMHGEEAERVQLISIVSKLSQAEDAIEVAKTPLKAAQKHRSTIIGLGKAAGFSAKELTKRLDEMRMPTREAAELEQREHKHRRWLGIVDDDQAELQLGDAAPAEAKDEAHWRAEGYKAGLRQQKAAPPMECGERFVQPWLEGHSRGYKEAMESMVPGGKRLREKAEEDFKADNPEVDLKKAAAKLKADKDFMDRTPPSNDEGFEATEEELAGQSTRQVVQAIAAAATEDEAVV